MKVISVVFSISIILGIFSCSKKEKLCYVMPSKVFDGFNGTKELDKKLKKKQELQRNILDSLRIEIQAGEGKLNEALLEKKKGTFNELLQRYSQGNENEYKQEAENLWKQINQYISEYGKAEGYVFILGANGTGSLMFADTTYDRSKEVIEYINAKYEGGK